MTVPPATSLAASVSRIARDMAHRQATPIARTAGLTA
jgi:hypothetical protein